MILPNDFDKAKAYDGKGGFTPLPAGGHICKIVGARETKSKNGNDMVEVAFDIAEGSDFDGRFQERFNSMRAQRADAKWPNGGMFRTSVLTSDGKTSGFFKGLITAIEESNPGYSFKATCDVNTMKGKTIGFNFGEEEYMGNDGKVHTSVKAAYAVSVQTVREGIEPPKKKEYKPRPGDMAAQGFTEVETPPDLPF